MRAPDKWELPRFQADFWFSAYSAPARCRPSAHLQVTRAVSQPIPGETGTRSCLRPEALLLPITIGNRSPCMM